MADRRRRASRSRQEPPIEQVLAELVDVDRVVHEPGRLAVLAWLRVAKRVDFTFLQSQTQMTRGNLSSHLKKLEDAGYITVEKTFVERVPRTLYELTPQGRDALDEYRMHLSRLLAALPPSS